MSNSAGAIVVVETSRLLDYRYVPFYISTLIFKCFPNP
jgi:hypothetical protein